MRQPAVLHNRGQASRDLQQGPECLSDLQFGVFWTCGQICSSTSRLLVQEGIADKFYKQLKLRAESIKISDPLEEDCRLGPVISAMQYEKVMGAVEVRLHF